MGGLVAHQSGVGGLMKPTPLPRVLIIDDEPHVLSALRRQLRSQFSVETASGGREALARIAEAQPFAVVLSDYQMPEMNGAALLAAVRDASPETTRILMTGQADLTGAAAAVNEGRVFQFILKPAPTETIAAALSSGIEQHRLVTAERDLLDKTLRSAVRALIDLLALASPLVFARATRIRELVRAITAAAGVSFDWHLELAAMLSQVGAITLPPAALQRLEMGEPNAEDHRLIARLPALADELLGDIPRLEPVRETMRRQDDDLDSPELPLGARALRIASDFDLAEQAGGAERALAELRARTATYDPHLLRALDHVVGNRADQPIRHVTVDELEIGMVIADDVFTASGLKLVARGHEVTPNLLERLGNFAQLDSGVRERVAVVADGSPEPVEAAS